VISSKCPWRRLLARVLVLALAVGAVPANCLAGETPPAGQSSPTLTASAQKAVALEVGKIQNDRSPARPAFQDKGGSTTDLSSKSFFKSPAGIVTLVLVGIGVSGALYSTKNDRIKSPAK